MIRLVFVVMMLSMTIACQKKDPVTTCNMTYNCGFNASCQTQYGTSTHAGSFSNGDEGTAEAECVAWEYAFINGYGSTYSGIHPVVSQCSCSTN